MDDSTYIDLDELFTKKETLQGGNHIFDPNEWLQLIDNFIMLGETEADDFVIDPAIELCEALIARGSRESHAHLRLARCHFLRGRYSAARSHVSECLASPSCDDAVREEAAAFTEELTTRVSADGKVGLVAIAAIVLGGVFWYLSYRNRTDGSSTGDFGDDAGRNAGQGEGHDGMA